MSVTSLSLLVKLTFMFQLNPSVLFKTSNPTIASIPQDSISPILVLVNPAPVLKGIGAESIIKSLVTLV